MKCVLSYPQWERAEGERKALWAVWRRAASWSVARIRVVRVRPFKRAVV